MRHKISMGERFFIAFCLFLILCIMAGFPLLYSRISASRTSRRAENAMSSDTISDQLTENLVFTDRSVPAVSSFEKIGQLFPDSGERTLTEEEISDLRSCVSTSFQYRILIRLAINEIYARKGLHFSESGPFWSFYSNFDWYTDSLRDGVGDNDLSDLEKDNVALLSRLEKEERESAAFYSSLVELVPLSGTYEQARRYATCLGGSLIRITDAGTQGIVEDMIDSSGKQQRFWTAGYYQDGKWRWDETNAVEFSAWAEDEPSESGSGARLLVSEDGSWVSEEDLSSSCMFLIRYNR